MPVPPCRDFLRSSCASKRHRVKPASVEDSRLRKVLVIVTHTGKLTTRTGDGAEPRVATGSVSTESGSLRSGQFGGVRHLLDGQPALGRGTRRPTPHVRGRGLCARRDLRHLACSASSRVRSRSLALRSPRRRRPGGPGDRGPDLGAEPGKRLGGGHARLPWWFSWRRSACGRPARTRCGPAASPALGRLAADADLGVAREQDVPVDRRPCDRFAIVNDILARECGGVGEAGNLVAVLLALVVLALQSFSARVAIRIAVVVSVCSCTAIRAAGRLPGGIFALNRLQKHLPVLSVPRRSAPTRPAG